MMQPLKPIRAARSAWGRARPLHKYLSRHWSVPKQDWTYIYPDEPKPVGGGMGIGEPEEQHDQAQAGEELQFRREQAMDQDLSSGPAGPGESGREPSKEPAEDNDEKKVFLEGFEEGYKLGKKVEAAEES